MKPTKMIQVPVEARLEDGTPITACIRVEGDELIFKPVLGATDENRVVIDLDKVFAALPPQTAAAVLRKYIAVRETVT